MSKARNTNFNSDTKFKNLCWQLKDMLAAKRYFCSKRKEGYYVTVW